MYYLFLSETRGRPRPRGCYKYLRKFQLWYADERRSFVPRYLNRRFRRVENSKKKKTLSNSPLYEIASGLIYM